jgi:hypothetical protein
MQRLIGVFGKSFGVDQLGRHLVSFRSKWTIAADTEQ